MTTTARTLGGYAAIADKRPINLRQIVGYVVVTPPIRFVMTAVAKTMLMTMINSVAKITWTDSTIDLGTPEVVAQNGKNTKIAVTPKSGSGYIGSYDLFFDRIDFERLFVGLVTNTPLTAVTNLQNALDQINTRYGTYLVLSDVVTQSLSGQTSVTLVAAAGSLILKPGSQITIGA